MKVGDLVKIRHDYKHRGKLGIITKIKPASLGLRTFYVVSLMDGHMPRFNIEQCEVINESR